jgi:hypothetical protein
VDPLGAGTGALSEVMVLERERMSHSVLGHFPSTFAILKGKHCVFNALYAVAQEMQIEF